MKTVKNTNSLKVCYDLATPLSVECFWLCWNRCIEQLYE
ncbi:hypothetical protein CAEBREN_05832 [Caenorhabditis brenneri]|uniref:Uncharacterized protein n=1 Tax=Caenorhabditis brenneri TaxID=135651 RepID=G0MU75_CAEBE|nr:hypothetical protein CAEBREN_05832 [Caenorhabditis brenneri]